MAKLTAKEIARRIFRVRSFKGTSPAVLKRRFRLATGLIRDVSKGKLSLKTALLLAEEGYDRLLAGGPLSPLPATAQKRRRVVKKGKAVFGSKSVFTDVPIKSPPIKLPPVPIPPLPPGFPPTARSHASGHGSHHTTTQRGARRLRRTGQNV